MTVSPGGSPPQGDPPANRKPLITTEGLLYLTLGTIAAVAAFVNPPVGIAIGVGLAVIGLLTRLT